MRAIPLQSSRCTSASVTGPAALATIATLGTFGPGVYHVTGCASTSAGGTQFENMRLVAGGFDAVLSSYEGGFDLWIEHRGGEIKIIAVAAESVATVSYYVRNFTATLWARSFAECG